MRKCVHGIKCCKKANLKCEILVFPLQVKISVLSRHMSDISLHFTIPLPFEKNNKPLVGHTLSPCDLPNNSCPSWKLLRSSPFNEISWSWPMAPLTLVLKDERDKTINMFYGANETSWPTGFLSNWLLSRNADSLLQATKLTTEIIETFFAVSVGIRACQCYSLWSLCCFWEATGGAAQWSLLQFDLLDNSVPNLHLCISRVSVLCLKTNHR